MRISRRGFIGGSAAARGVAAGRAARGRGRCPTWSTSPARTPRRWWPRRLAALGGIGTLRQERATTSSSSPTPASPTPPEWGTTTHPDTVVGRRQGLPRRQGEAGPHRRVPAGQGREVLRALRPQRGPRRAARGEGQDALGAGRLPEGRGEGRRGAQVHRAGQGAPLRRRAHQPPRRPRPTTQTGVSFGLKNAMGLILRPQVFHTMLDLHQAVADLGAGHQAAAHPPRRHARAAHQRPRRPGRDRDPGRASSPAATSSRSTPTASPSPASTSKQLTPADARHIELAAKAGLGEARPRQAQGEEGHRLMRRLP